MRWIASNNGKKSTSNPGMVNNKNNNNKQRVKRQNRTEYEPPLTIYPRDKLDFLKKPNIELKTENVPKTTKNNANIAIDSKLNDKSDKNSNKNELKKKEKKVPTTANEMPTSECVSSSNLQDKKVFGWIYFRIDDHLYFSVFGFCSSALFCVIQFEFEFYWFGFGSIMIIIIFYHFSLYCQLSWNRFRIKFRLNKLLFSRFYVKYRKVYKNHSRKLYSHHR